MGKPYNFKLMHYRSLGKFLAYVKPYRWMIAGATLCGLLKYNIPVAFPWVLKDVIDHLVSPSHSYTLRLNLTMIALILLYFLWAAVTYLRSYLADQVGQRLIFDLRNALYVHLQRMSLGFFERRQVGSIASRVIGDISIAQNFVGATFTNTIMDISALFLILSLLFYMNWRLALVSITILPFYVLLNRMFRDRIRKTSRMAQQKMEEISGDVHEKLGGIALVQSYTGEEYEQRHFYEENLVYLSHLLSNIKNNASAVAWTGLLTSVAPVLVIWYGAMQVIHGHLTVGGLAAFYAYLGMLYQPLNRLTELNVLLANSLSAMDRIIEIFDTSPEVLDRPMAKEIGAVKGEIEFKNVSFSYGNSNGILKGINLLIPVGTTVALVGPSGAGKSTFVKLIPRFYDVSEGSITIDGIDLREIKLKSLRNQIALVSQEPILFSGTIHANILYGKPDASEEEVLEAAKAADAHNFIMDLLEGYQTEIGEGGVRLSGGQRQRIALARAFLKDAPILILDEATSSLDSESENSIQAALIRLMRGRTTLIIAHRLSTIQSADRIVVFNEGTIVETGTHSELLERSEGLYRRLYKEQFDKFLTPVTDKFARDRRNIALY